MLILFLHPQRLEMVDMARRTSPLRVGGNEEEQASETTSGSS